MGELLWSELLCYLVATGFGVMAHWGANRLRRRGAGNVSLLCANLAPFSHVLAVGTLHYSVQLPLYAWIDGQLRVLAWPWHQAMAYLALAGLSCVYVLLACCTPDVLGDMLASARVVGRRRG